MSLHARHRLHAGLAHFTQDWHFSCHTHTLHSHTTPYSHTSRWTHTVHAGVRAFMDASELLRTTQIFQGRLGSFTDDSEVARTTRKFHGRHGFFCTSVCIFLSVSFLNINFHLASRHFLVACTRLHKALCQSVRRCLKQLPPFGPKI